MLKLRTILLCDNLYYLILLITVIISIPRLLITKESVYSEETKFCTGNVLSYTKNKNTLNITLKCKEKVIVYFYDENNITIKLGDKLRVTGVFQRPKENTTKYLFNYRKYLYNKNIFYTIKATTIEKLSSTKSLWYKIKQYVLTKASTSPYIKAILFGDTSGISQTIIQSYQENGISHLFAISGMHITILSSFFLNALKKLNVKEKKRYFITCGFIIIYLFLIKTSPSALRGVLFFILFSINKIYYFYIKPQNIFIMVLVSTLLINPFYIYDIGFQFSFVISITLILTSKFITGKYFLKLLKTSAISFLISMPISMLNYFQVNIMSIIYNMFYVPFVNILIFPLSIITLFIKPFLPIYNFLILILEKTSIFFSKISFGKIIFKRLPLIFYLIYFILIVIVLINLSHNRKKSLYLLLIILFIHSTYPSFISSTYIKMIDVGQGDSVILYSNGEAVLIDTGGKLSFSQEDYSSIVTNITMPLLKSLGIKKIDSLILTHGDADHMGEAKYLLSNFKVKEIYLNQGELNYLEKELLTLSSNIKTSYEGLTLTIGEITLLQLNEDLNDENDSSQIYYGKHKNISFLLTGDASVKSEKSLLNKYELSKIDILKVGHHGSYTSTSKELLKAINPKICLISVGKDNKFGHPTETVLERLNTCKVYRTDQTGTITLKLMKNKLEIEAG